MESLKKQLVNALKQTNIPVYYELFLDSNCSIPCISYYESENRDEAVSLTNTEGHSFIKFTVKLWAHTVDDMETYSAQIDNYLRQINYRRNSSIELVEGNLMCKVMTYKGITTLEKYGG